MPSLHVINITARQDEIILTYSAMCFLVLAVITGIVLWINHYHGILWHILTMICCFAFIFSGVMLGFNYVTDVNSDLWTAPRALVGTNNLKLSNHCTTTALKTVYSNRKNMNHQWAEVEKAHRKIGSSNFRIHIENKRLQHILLHRIYYEKSYDSINYKSIKRSKFIGKQFVPHRKIARIRYL